MTNIYDYLLWRGDLSFEVSPFNEVDNLILSTLCYMEWEDAVPSGDNPISVSQAAQAYFKSHEHIEKLSTQDTMNPLLISTQMLDQLTKSKRFGQLMLVNYVSIIDIEHNEQFAAITVLLDDNEAYVAFRGTDHSIVGWREDFNLSFLPQVPAQRDALIYLEACVGLGTRKTYVGGHSKGGNLAVYAAAHASAQVQDRILMVYNNDGPGFNRASLDEDGYRRLENRTRTIVPQSSMVGMMFEHEEAYVIVKSAQVGFMQHMPLNWEVQGTKFIEVPELSTSSVLFDHTFRDWLSSLTEEQLRTLTDTLFDALESTGATTFEQLNETRLASVRMVLRSLGGIDPKSRKILMDIVGKLADASRKNTLSMLRERLHNRRASSNAKRFTSGDDAALD